MQLPDTSLLSLSNDCIDRCLVAVSPDASLFDAVMLMGPAARIHSSIEPGTNQDGTMKWLSAEIRTPMNAILGFADLLQSVVNEPRPRSYLDAIASSGRTLLGLINDILDLSKIEAGKLELHYKSVDLRSLVRDILQIFSQKATEKNNRNFSKLWIGFEFFTYFQTVHFWHH